MDMIFSITGRSGGGLNRSTERGLTMQGLLINSALDAVRRLLPPREGVHPAAWTSHLAGPGRVIRSHNSLCPLRSRRPGIRYRTLYVRGVGGISPHSTLFRAQPTRTRHPTSPEHSMSATTALMSSTLSASSIFQRQLDDVRAEAVPTKSFTVAWVLAFPVRSLKGVFAGATGSAALERFVRDTAQASNSLHLPLQ